MTTSGRPRILFVDDEPNVLSGLRRTLASNYNVVTASSGAEGLETLAGSCETDAFAVVVSDMRMPAMNGAEFLRRAHLLRPDAVLLILSGQADLASTVEAVNDANLFRFLTKPCAPDDLRRGLDDALRQYELVLAERDLLERTVSGSVAMMVKLLSIANPEAFNRTDRIRSLVEAAAERLGVHTGWELRIAAMLSQVGCVAVPESILERVRFGGVLSTEDREIYESHPSVAKSLIESIPRLERVAAWVGAQPPVPRSGDTCEEQELLYATIAFLDGRDAGRSPRRVATELAPHYKCEVLAALLDADGVLDRPRHPRDVTVAEILIDMLLDQDVVAANGMMLVRRGESVNETLLLRLRNFATTVGVVEPIRVLVATHAPRN
jgi:CheY-like chemotaxis protein